MSVSQRPVRVVLVDDHPLLLDGLSLALDVAGIEVSATAGSVQAAVDTVRRCQPDVVVMDVQLPDGNGVEATRRVRLAAPSTAVLMLTMLDDDETLAAALAAGARGYVVKGASGREIARAVLAVAAGDAIFGAGVAERVIASATGQAARAAPFPELTDREHEVLALIAQGLPNAAIAQQLTITAKTAANHVSSILMKLQVADRTQAALRAREAGL